MNTSPAKTVSHLFPVPAMHGLKLNSRTVAWVTAKPIPCLNGPVLVGTTYVTSIPRMLKLLGTKLLKNTGCPSTFTLAAWNTQSYTRSTHVSGIKFFMIAVFVSTKEPFQKLFNQGMILAYSYRDENGKYYSPEDVDNSSGKPVAISTGMALDSKIEKMSKSRLNVVSPDDVIDQYGADAMRLYELFMGPLEQVKPWQMSGVDGVSRFLQRVWRLAVDETTGELQSRLTDAPGTSEEAL